MKKSFFKMFLVIALFSAFNLQTVRAEEKKMAASAGLGITYPMGDMGDVLGFPIIPLLASFQYALNPFLTLEGDFSYFLVASPEDPITDYSQYQIGVGARYWLTKDFKKGKSYDGFYAGVGLAKTKVEIEVEYTMPFYGTVSEKYDDSFTTLVLKGGYIYPVSSILLDLGVRYDAVDLDNWFDQGVTVYGMALFLF